MLIIKLIGVAMIVGLAVKWKRIRLPLLLLLLVMLLYRALCGSDAPVKLQDHGPMDPRTAPDGRRSKPRDPTLDPYACPDRDRGCTDPGTTVDAGQP
ncbi:MAG TPA: hypothetical protein VF469_20130 [Kofleriaceae bacterium]